MADLKITNEIREIINQCRFDGLKVYLPDIQLDRKLYTQVNALFAELKGVWNRKEKAHIFPSDPREKLGILAAQDKLVDSKKLYQSFFTPIEVAKRAVELAEIEVGNIILEPSAGHGALIDQILTYDGVDVDAVELNPEFAEFLEDKYGMRIYLYRGDFLNWKPIDAKDPQIYNRAILNPPFNKFRWISHVQHAYKFLKPGGKLVAITPDSLSNKKFQDFVADKKWEFEPVAEKAFAESGTNINTNIVIINK